MPTPLPGLAVQPDEHPVAAFHRWVAAIPDDKYPPELAPVAGRHVRGTAAFPAGDGLYVPCGEEDRPRPAFPVGGLMLIANHLDGVENYLSRLGDGRPHGDPCPGGRPMPYWRVLYDELLAPAGIPRDQIFATNLHPALWAAGGAQGAVRRRGAVNVAWRRHVEQILAAEMRVMKPRVIAVFGDDARRAVTSILGTALDMSGPVTATLPGGRPAAVAALLHPSARPPQVALRSWGGRTGRAADAAILAAAWTSPQT